MTVVTGQSVSTHYTCAKGNEHWLSHVTDWDGDQQYFDGCRVHINIERGHIVHLTVLGDSSEDDANTSPVDPT